MEPTQAVNVSWQIKSLEDILGVLALVVIIGIVVVVVVSVLSKNGIQVGKFRAGLRRKDRNEGEECAMYKEHSGILGQLAESIGAVSKTLSGILNMQHAQNAALDVLLGNLEGEKINGQVRNARLGLAKAIGFQEAKFEETKVGAG